MNLILNTKNKKRTVFDFGLLADNKSQLTSYNQRFLNDMIDYGIEYLHNHSESLISLKISNKSRFTFSNCTRQGEGTLILIGSCTQTYA